MSAVEISCTVDVRQIVRAFERVRKIDVKRIFKELVGPARFDQRHHWRKDEAPDGHWPGLAPSTLERRTRKRGRGKDGRNRSWPKKLLGRFPTSLQAIPSQNSLIMRSRIAKFSLIHNEGGTAGHGARIPRRQYLWISDWLKGQVVKYFEKGLARAYYKGP